MSSIMVPDSLPPLVRGLGAHPATGGCLMQVTNYLANGKWTDGPARNVHPTLQRMAISMNDGVCDAHRKELWPFVPRLMRTFDVRRGSSDTFNDVASDFYFQSTYAPCVHCLNFNPLSVIPDQAHTCCHHCTRLIETFSLLLDAFDIATERRQTSVPINWLEARAQLMTGISPWAWAPSVNVQGPDVIFSPVFVTPPVAVILSAEEMLAKLRGLDEAFLAMSAIAQSVPEFDGQPELLDDNDVKADIDMLVEVL